MGLFLSTFINKKDKKDRVSVPSGFRAALSEEKFQGIVLFRSYTHPAIEAVGLSVMQGMSDRMDHHFAFFSENHDELATVLFGESVQLSFDGDGRITVPSAFLDHAQIDDHVAFVGMGQKFQLWNPDLLDQQKEKARQAVQNKKITLPKEV